jgi:hypothetical protein
MAREATGQVVTRTGKRGVTYAARVRAYGERHYVSLGYSWEGYTHRRAETELQNILADIRRGTWQPPQPEPAPAPAQDPTFHEFASQWLDGLRHELAPRTIEDYELALSHHLLPFFKDHRLPQITAQETDRYKAAKVREREQGTVERPLSNRTINKTLTRLGQILDVAVRYELIPHNPVKGRVAKLKELPPARERMQGYQVQVLLQHAGRHRVLLATAIMAGGLRVSELINLRWRDVDLTAATLQVPVSKTEAGLRLVHLEAELVALLRSTSSPPDGVSRRTSSSPAAAATAHASATASVPAYCTPASSAPTRPSKPADRPRSPPASPSTPCAAPTPRYAPSSASTPRSPPRRWATPIPA